MNKNGTRKGSEKKHFSFHFRRFFFAGALLLFLLLAINITLINWSYTDYNLQRSRLDELVGISEFSPELSLQSSHLITEEEISIVDNITPVNYLFTIGTVGIMTYIIWLVLITVIIILAIKIFKYRATSCKAENRMSEKSREQEKIDTGSENIIIRYDRQGSYTFINPAFEKYTCLSKDELLNKTIEETSKIFSGFATDIQTWKKKLETVMATGQVEEWSTHYKGKSGSYHLLISLQKDFDFERREDSVLVTVKDITSKRKQEEITVECEKRFIDLIHNNPGIAVTGFDEEGKIIFWNKASARIYGYTEKEALGKNITELIIHPEAKDRFEKDFQKLKDKSKEVKGQKTIRLTKKGSELLTYAEYLKTEGIDRTAEFFAFDFDLSGLKDSSDKDTQKIIHLFDQIEELIFVSDPKSGQIVYKNSYTDRLIEHNRVKSSWYKALKENKDPTITHNKQMKLSAGEAPLIREYYDKELNTHFMIVEKLIDWNEDKKAKLTIVIDVNPVKEKEMSLKDEKGFLYSTLESIGEGVIATDKNGQITLMNKAAEELTGWTAAEAEGNLIDKVMVIIDEKTGEQTDKSILQMIETDTAIGIVNNPVLVAKDGSKKALYISGAPIFNKEDEILGDIIVFHDITPRKRMEDELIKSQKLESLGTLAAGIAYDFNNLLSSLFGYIEMAMVFHNSKEKVAQYLTRALGIYERATGLTDKLITFSRRGIPETKTTSIDEILDEAAQYALSGSKVRYKMDLDSELWLCDVDRTQILQVFNNLMLNAVQAMPDGGIITIKGENVPGSDAPEWTGKTSNYIKISIVDKGTGIPETYLERIFDPFFTTKQQGSGLGLPIAYSIINKHRGNIDVSSIPGEGSTFSVYLPASKSAIHDIDEEEDALEVYDSKILIMDDDPIVTDTVKVALEEIGYTVINCSNGSKALLIYEEEYLKGEPFDLVIFDLTVPGELGGLETLQILRERYPDILAIASSGYLDNPVMKDPQKFGFYDKIEKPYSIDGFIETIHTTLKDSE